MEATTVNAEEPDPKTILARFLLGTVPIVLMFAWIFWDVILPVKAKRHQARIIASTAARGSDWEVVQAQLKRQGFTFELCTSELRTSNSKLPPIYRAVNVARRSYTLETLQKLAAWTQERGYAIPANYELRTPVAVVIATSGTVLSVL